MLCSGISGWCFCVYGYNMHESDVMARPPCILKLVCLCGADADVYPHVCIGVCLRCMFALR